MKELEDRRRSAALLVLRVLVTPIAVRTPLFGDAVHAARKYGISAEELLVLMKERIKASS